MKRWPNNQHWWSKDRAAELSSWPSLAHFKLSLEIADLVTRLSMWTKLIVVFCLTPFSLPLKIHMISAVRAIVSFLRSMRSIAFARSVGDIGVLLSPLSSQLGSVTGMDLPEAIKVENEVKVGPWHHPVPCSLREGCAKQLLVPSNLPSTSCSEGRSRLTGRREPSSCASLHTLQTHSSVPGVSNLGSQSIASSGIRISVVLLKWVGPHICFQIFCRAVGIKGSLVVDLRKKLRGSITIHRKCSLSAMTNYWDFFCRIECSPSTLAYSLALILITSSVLLRSWYFLVQIVHYYFLICKWIGFFFYLIWSDFPSSKCTLQISLRSNKFH